MEQLIKTFGKIMQVWRHVVQIIQKPLHASLKQGILVRAKCVRPAEQPR